MTVAAIVILAALIGGMSGAAVVVWTLMHIDTEITVYKT